MNRRQHALFPGFAGVALADILANSVAIVILMIVITIFVKHEEDQKKVEQVEDVSVLLSREIATSVVMNAIPTSPPSRLHDYTLSPLDRNLHPSIMPIIELHDGYVRNYYTGKKISRDELLLQNNSLDKFLRGLTPNQLVRLRVDIYSIRLFYIVMSIFKSKAGRLPYHWHFLDAPTPKSKQEAPLMATDDDKQGMPSDTDTDATEETEDALADENNSDNTDQAYNEGALGMSVPEQTSLFSGEGGENNPYPYSDLSFETPNDFGKTDLPPDLPGSQDEKNNLENDSDSVFSAFAKMMQESLSKKSPSRMGGSSIRSRFRNASPNAAQENSSELDIKQERNGSSAENGKPPLSFLQVLPALFDYMEEVQSNTNRGQDLSMLANYNFYRDVLSRIGKTRQFSAEEIDLFVNIAGTIKTIPDKKKDKLLLETKEDERTTGKILSIPINQRVTGATLLHDEYQTNLAELSGELNIVGQFSLYPEIYQGLSFSLLEDMLILMPLNQLQTETFHWRVITLVSPALDDFVTAYVYAKIDQNHLLIASDENALKASSIPMLNQFPTVPFRQESWQILLYSLISLLILFGIVSRYRRTS
ncbi:MAG: hypothetical protein ACNYNY_04630 [Candidatus Oxydemutatoraceae bacterium WSBS_2016_MAG_OTU14]